MAKVILVDNFNREYIEDKLLKDNLTDREADDMANDYNSKRTSNWDWFARAVPDDYKLWRGIEEII